MGFTAGKGHRRNVVPIGRFLQLEEFFANFSCKHVELRIPIAQHPSHTPCHSAAHLEEVEEAVLEVEEAALLPVEVRCLRGSSAVAIANPRTGRGGFGGASSFGPPDQVYGMCDICDAQGSC